MSALYGFFGPPDPTLIATMRRALRHRGESLCHEEVTSHATIGLVTDHDEATCERLGTGHYATPDGALSVTLSGQLLAPRESAEPALKALLERYRAEGTALWPQLRGAFVLAIRDGDTLHLVRDGVGARTLVWTTQGGRTRFNVESKGLVCDPSVPRRLRPGAVAQYLSFSFIPGKGTMLEGIEELLPGHTLTLKPGRAPTQTRWFHFEDPEDTPALSADAWIERIAFTHAQAVQERTPPESPFATFLSGGLDSSIVVAELKSQGHRGAPTYSIHFGPRYDHELDFARSVAERCGTDHHEVLIRPKDFLPRLKRAIWHMDEPIGDPITIPNFELARRVSQDYRWVFNGEGGDPLFGGPKNLTMMLHHWYGAGDRSPGFRERRYLESYRRAYTELEHLLTPEFRSRFDPRADLEGILTPYFEAERPRSFLHKLLAINLRLKGAHLILPKVERMLGAWGVTPLSPLFDERLVRLSFAMPPTMKIREGLEKRVLKDAYAKRLPQEVIDRPKSGMRVPVHHWFKDELKWTARRLLSKRRIKRAGIFNPERVEALKNYAISEGPGRYGLRLWMLLTFEIWREQVLEGKSP